MSIILGTAQFGLNYGISNQLGKVSLTEASSILKYACQNGVRTIDTAQSYGDSEEVLGTIGSSEKFKIITKVCRVSQPTITRLVIDELERAFISSLNKLGKIHTLLIHDPNDLKKQGEDLLWSWLKEKKTSGVIQSYGVSVYTADDIDLAMSQSEFGIIQLPLNLFDQRLIYSGHLKKLKNNGVEIHARSLFLQGLIFMKRYNSYFKPIKKRLDNFHQFCEDNQLTPLEISLAFAKSIHEVDQYVFGVTNTVELEEIINGFSKEYSSINFSQFNLNEERFINPGKWELT